LKSSKGLNWHWLCNLSLYKYLSQISNKSDFYAEGWLHMKKNILTYTIAFLAVVFTMGFYFASKTLNQPVLKNTVAIDNGYFMPRMQKIISFFSLQDRSVIYSYINPFVSKNKAAKNATQLVAKEINTRELKAKETRSTEVAKKLVSKNNKLKKQAQKKNDPKTKQDQLISNVSNQNKLNSENTTQKSGLNKDSVANVNQNETSPAPVAAVQDSFQTSGLGNINTVNNQDLSAEEKAKKELLAAQEKEAQFWRETLQNQPTAENALLMVQALKDEKISLNQYYKIIEEMIASKSAEHEKVGLYLIYNQSSTNAFQMVAVHINSITAGNKQTARNYLDSYNETQKLTLLPTLLGSTNKTIKTEALTVLKNGVDKAKQGVAPYQVNARNERALAADNSLSVERYLNLIPLLKKISQEQEYATLTQQILNQLQTVVATVQ
jgi:hypothetical protein